MGSFIVLDIDRNRDQPDPVYSAVGQFSIIEPE
jgi:hypothetical protein